MNIHHWLFWGLLSALLLTGRLSSAQRRLIDSLKTTLHHKLPDTTRANTYYDIANVFYKQNQLDSAHQYLNRMQPLCLRTRNQLGLGHYNRLKGVLAMHEGNFDEALRFYLVSIDVYTKAHKLNSVAKVYNNLGLMYKMMGDSQHMQAHTRQGLAYIQQAVIINQKLNNLLSLSDTYVNLGIIYEDLGEYDRGRDCFLKALAINDQVHAGPDYYRVIYNNLGKNYNAAGQYQQAISYLNKSMAINRALNRPTSLLHNYCNLTNSYRGLKQTEPSLQYAEKALALVKICKDVPLAASVYKELANTYAATGHYEKAYESLVEQKRVEDSLINLEKTRTIAQLEGQYEVRKANELAALKASMDLAKVRALTHIEAEKDAAIAATQAKENQRMAEIRAAAEVEKVKAVAELQTKYETQKRVQQIAGLDQQNRQRSQQILYMAGGLFLLILLLSVLVNQYQIIRRTNKRLSAQNEIITANSQQLISQADQLRTLMKELHHRVKNNLAIVSSLLNLQAKGLNDEKAMQAVQVGQQRVEAMSLIHQRLYQTDQVTVVNMREYLTDLAERLMQAYGYQADTFQLQLDIEKQELDMDVAIPLGLIVNELVTNAFKYAYLQQDHPLLRIGLHRDNSPIQPGITLEIQDNGPGIEVADWRKADSRPSFGKRLVTSLCEQLEGQFELLKQDGTLFRLRIPQTRLSA